MNRLRSHGRAVTVVAVSVVVVAVIAVTYMVVFEDDDLPGGPDDEELQITPAEGIDFSATVQLGDESIEYDYQVTNQRDEAVIVVDPNGLTAGSPAEEGPESFWRAMAIRTTEPAPLDYWTRRGERVTAGLLLEPGESRSGHVSHRVIIDDPPERMELCVEVVELDPNPEAETEDGDQVGDPTQIELADRPSGLPVTVACTRALAVQGPD